MRIIAINRFYWPDQSATAQMLTDLAEHLAAHGHDVSVITSRLRYEGRAKLPQTEVRNGVRIRRVASTSFGRAGLLGRAFDYVSFLATASVALARAATPHDVVIAKTDPPLLIIPVALARWIRRFRLAHWCQDLFPETAAALGLTWARGGAGKALGRVRTFAANTADLTVALNTAMKEALVEAGIRADRITVLPNWADAAITPVPADANALRREWDLGDQFVIGYSGNLGRAHLARHVADLVTRTRTMPGLAWLFIGGGAGLADVRAAAAGAETVRFRPYQDRALLGQSLSAPDAHLISLDPACEGLVAPSKLYGVLAAGRPVVVLGDPEGSLARFVRHADCGRVLPLDAPDRWPDVLADLRRHAARLGANALRAHRPARDALEDWRFALEALDLRQPVAATAGAAPAP